MVHKLAVAAGGITIPGLHLSSEAGQMFASSRPTQCSGHNFSPWFSCCHTVIRKRLKASIHTAKNELLVQFLGDVKKPHFEPTSRSMGGKDFCPDRSCCPSLFVPCSQLVISLQDIICFRLNLCFPLNRKGSVEEAYMPFSTQHKVNIFPCCCHKVLILSSSLC